MASDRDNVDLKHMTRIRAFEELALDALDRGLVLGAIHRSARKPLPPGYVVSFDTTTFCCRPIEAMATRDPAKMLPGVDSRAVAIKKGDRVV